MSASPVSGEMLLELLGLKASEPAVQLSLSTLAHGMQPELDPDDDEIFNDWVTVNEIGLEYGFEDEAYLRALDPGLRRKGEVVLSQLYFYGDTPKTQPFPYDLPFGLSFLDDRPAVRYKMLAYEETRRSYIRDVWHLPHFDVTAAYTAGTNRLESVYCYIRRSPWPASPGEADLVAEFIPEFFVGLFGLRWSSTELRTRLRPLGYEQSLPEVRSEHMADFRRPHGLELMFAPGSQIGEARRHHPTSLALAGVNYYANRILDSAEWLGLLPARVDFPATQTELPGLVGRKPAQVIDEDKTGIAIWHFESFTLVVAYSNIENRVFRISMLEPEFWRETHKNDED